MKLISLTILLSTISAFSANWGNTKIDSNFVMAVFQVESGKNPKAVGDGGRAIGGLQIWKSCWKDTFEFNPKIGGNYSNCFNLDYSVKVMEAYFLRYEKNALKSNDFESLSRCWNGGCGWRKNKSKTDGYWFKVKAALK